MNKLLPQANNLDTVIKVFIYYSNNDSCTLSHIANFCSFEERQASYYLNACVYLGLISDDGNVTALGQMILRDFDNIKKEIYSLVINDDLIRPIFTRMLIFGNKDIKEFSISIVKNNYLHYSDAVIERRVSTLISWCETVIESLH